MSCRLLLACYHRDKMVTLIGSGAKGRMLITACWKNWGYKIPCLSPPSLLTLHRGKWFLVLLFSLKALSSPRLSSDKKNIILMHKAAGANIKYMPLFPPFSFTFCIFKSLFLAHDASRACLLPNDLIFRHLSYCKDHKITCYEKEMITSKNA